MLFYRLITPAQTADAGTECSVRVGRVGQAIGAGVTSCVDTTGVKN